jgi:uncharacterized protein
LDIETKADLAHKILHSMGLAQRQAPLVLLVGHASQSANNAHAASLDCGACCGQSGEINARVLASVLNDPDVRSKLEQRGVQISPNTSFIAALHNTTTDELDTFDLDLLNQQTRDQWEYLQPSFNLAFEQVRRERAASLGIEADSSNQDLLKKLRIRANDGAQTRPEWGLTGNASFLIAPRERSLGIDLQGRCFLHEYNHSQDPDYKILELLMTAPMLVTHWINWQYCASTCDPERMGSGNKVLQNVVGGHIGVFEGNGGDLRIGLSKQSLHDGENWVHEPIRLTVIIDAPQEAIGQIIARHEAVRNLIHNGWLHLWCFSDQGFLSFKDKRWRQVTLPPDAE